MYYPCLLLLFPSNAPDHFYIKYLCIIMLQKITNIVEKFIVEKLFRHFHIIKKHKLIGQIVCSYDCHRDAFRTQSNI